MKKILFAFIFIGIFFAIGFGFYFGLNEYAVTSNLDGEHYEVPVFGYFMCEESDEAIDYPSDQMIMFGYTTVTCQEAGTLTQDCVVNVQLPDKIGRAHV